MSTRKVRVTEAQLRLLIELTEPTRNEDGAWYFGTRVRRSGDVLVEHGFAVRTHLECDRVGYAITAAGRAYLASQNLVPEWPKAEGPRA